jgi:hypothetical protein
MDEPIVFISRNQVKPGMLDDFIHHYQESILATQVGKPGTLFQLAYVNEEATQVVIVRTFPDAESLDRQLQGADERSKLAYVYIQPLSMEIFGQPNPYALEMFQKVAGRGIEVTIKPIFIGGFVRPGPG